MHGEADCPRSCLALKDSIISALKANIEAKQEVLEIGANRFVWADGWIPTSDGLLGGR